ncbi:hypothetical protein ACWKSR_10930, partial [Campylobacter fetus subsp. venerealis]
NESRNSYEKFYKIENPELIYNGCAKPSTTEKYEEVKKEIDSLKYNQETLVFIHLSRYNENQKQHLVLINAFNRIKIDFKNVILLIIGRDYESAEAEILKKSA